MLAQPIQDRPPNFAASPGTTATFSPASKPINTRQRKMCKNFIDLLGF